MVVEDEGEADELLEIAERSGYEASIAGEIINRPEIRFNGHTWRY
jgi:selenophosphate synthetase-related protein